MDYDETASVTGWVNKVSLKQDQRELIAAVESKACQIRGGHMCKIKSIMRG